MTLMNELFLHIMSDFYDYDDYSDYSRHRKIVKNLVTAASEDYYGNFDKGIIEVNSHTNQ